LTWRNRSPRSGGSSNSSTPSTNNNSKNKDEKPTTPTGKSTTPNSHGSSSSIKPVARATPLGKFNFFFNLERYNYLTRFKAVIFLLFSSNLGLSSFLPLRTPGSSGRLIFYSAEFHNILIGSPSQLLSLKMTERLYIIYDSPKSRPPFSDGYSSAVQVYTPHSYILCFRFKLSIPAQ